MGLRYGEGYGSAGGGGGGSSGGGSYTVTSVSKVRSSSSGGARRAQGAGSSGGVSPGFRERKVVSSRSGGYDGERRLRLRLKKRKQSANVCAAVVCFLPGSSSANSSPEFTRKDYGIYCE